MGFFGRFVYKPAGLSAWAGEVLDVSVPAAQIRPLLADEGVEDPEDAFVEEPVARLIELLRLPLPDALRDA